MTYEEMCSFEVLYKAYKRARKGKRGKAGAAHYEAHALASTERLSRLLSAEKYQPSPFELFWVHEPKKRLVQAPAFVDKVVQHALVDEILYDALARSYITDSHASQIGKGTHVGLDRLEHHMRSYFLKRKGRDEELRRSQGLPHRPMAEWDYAEGWILKADVRQFFHSIDLEVAKEKLRGKVEDEKVFSLMCTYIDCSDMLPLGYQTSQLLALMYLDDFDHWVKERLRIKYYGRYMDDFYLVHEDRAYLKRCLRDITEYLAGLHLELNNKTNIFPLRNGIDFLGFHTYLTETGKVVRKLRRSSRQRMNGRIKRWRAEIAEGRFDREKAIKSYESWDVHAAHGDTRELREKYRGRMMELFKEA